MGRGRPLSANNELRRAHRYVSSDPEALYEQPDKVCDGEKACMPNAVASFTLSFNYLRILANQGRILDTFCCTHCIEMSPIRSKATFTAFSPMIFPAVGTNVPRIISIALALAPARALKVFAIDSKGLYGVSMTASSLV